MSSDQNEYLSEFKELVKKDVAVPISAMKTLITVIKRSKGTTWMQLEEELSLIILLLKDCSANDLLGRTKISLGSGCDLFMKYLTRAFLDYSVRFAFYLSYYFLIFYPIFSISYNNIGF